LPKGPFLIWQPYSAFTMLIRLFLPLLARGRVPFPSHRAHFFPFFPPIITLFFFQDSARKTGSTWRSFDLFFSRFFLGIFPELNLGREERPSFRHPFSMVCEGSLRENLLFPFGKCSLALWSFFPPPPQGEFLSYIFLCAPHEQYSFFPPQLLIETPFFFLSNFFSSSLWKDGRGPVDVLIPLSFLFPLRRRRSVYSPKAGNESFP